MRWPYNETINSFRWALKHTYEEVLRFDETVTPDDFRLMIEALLHERGVEDEASLGHDPELFEKVRRRLGWR